MKRKRKLYEKIYRARKDIKRVWIERKEVDNNSVFKVGTKYSYIINIINKTVKIIPYDERYHCKGTVSKKYNGEVAIIDICNKKIKDLFKDYIEYKINIYEDEIIIEGFKKKDSARVRQILRLPIYVLDNIIENNDIPKNIIDDYNFIKTYDKDKPILNKTIRLLSLFSGIGAFEKALEKIGQKFELVNYCEYDKKHLYISKAYSLIHNIPETKNLGDITKVDETQLDDFDIVTAGFPCQDISGLGNQDGFFDKNNNKTRSGLFFDAIRIIKYKKPKIVIFENVKDLAYKKMSYCLDIMKSIIKDIGYNFYYKVLNTKDFGLPHSRRRFFGICIRKDIDNYNFEFPPNRKLIRKASSFYDDIDTIPDECYVGPEQYKYFNEFRLKKKYSSLNSDVLVCMTTKQGQKSNPQNFIHDERGYRMLTAKEMFALQGFPKSDATKLLENGFTLNQIGYMCGNTISVTVLESIFLKLSLAFPNIFGKLNIVDKKGL